MGNSAEPMHRLLDKQVREATQPDGEVDLARLLAAIDGAYGKTDEERRGVVRSMQLMSDETSALTRELRESTASQLQAVLDHVKDVIMTVDEAGHIASINATGQRVFGHADAEIIGRPLSFLLPQLGTRCPLHEELEELAARLEDTQVDLAPHETVGLNAWGANFPAEIAVSKTRLNRRPMFVVCLRDTTDRKASEAALRDSEARYRTLVEHAPEIIVVVDLDQNRLVDLNENAVRFFKMERERIALDLRPLKANLTGKAGRQAVEIVAGALPECGEPGCPQPSTVAASIDLAAFAADQPDALVLAEKPEPPDPREQLALGRMLLGFAPLALLLLLGAVGLFGARSRTGWLRWCGAPLLLAGAIAVGVGFATGPINDWTWSMAMLETERGLTVEVVTQLRAVFAAVNAEVVRHLQFEGGVVALAGLALVLLSFFVPDRRHPAA